MDKQALMQEFVSSAITPLLERVVTKKLVQVFDVIAEDQKARIATLAAENKALREALGQLHDSASEYGADQSGANDPRCGVVQPITVADGEALNDALRCAAALLEKK